MMTPNKEEQIRQEWRGIQAEQKKKQEEWYAKCKTFRDICKTKLDPWDLRALAEEAIAYMSTDGHIDLLLELWEPEDIEAFIRQYPDEHQRLLDAQASASVIMAGQPTLGLDVK